MLTIYSLHLLISASNKMKDKMACSSSVVDAKKHIEQLDKFLDYDEYAGYLPVKEIRDYITQLSPTKALSDAIKESSFLHEYISCFGNDEGDPSMELEIVQTVLKLCPEAVDITHSDKSFYTMTHQLKIFTTIRFIRCVETGTLVMRSLN